MPIVDAFADGGYHAGDFVSEMRGRSGSQWRFFLRSVPQMPQVCTRTKQFTRAIFGTETVLNARHDAAINQRLHGAGIV